jgi:hypothetical protein
MRWRRLATTKLGETGPACPFGWLACPTNTVAAQRRAATQSSTKTLRNQTPSIFWSRDDNNLGPYMNVAKAKQVLSHAATLLLCFGVQF